MLKTIAALGPEAKRAGWKNAYFGLIGFFYFFQGLHLSGIMTFGTIRMAEWDVPVAAQALLKALIAIPSFVKMFSGLLSDRVPFGRLGRRRPYFIASVAVYVPAFIILLAVDSFGGLFIASLLGVMVGWMFIDSTMDGLAVDITPQEHQGRFQGIHSAARLAGFAIGSVFIPMLGPAVGWSLTIGILFAAALLQAGASFFFREPSVSREELKGLMPLGTVMKQAFGSRRPWMGIILMLSLSAIAAIPGVAQLHILTDLGWSRDPGRLALYGWLNLALFGGGAAGSFVFGRLFARHGESMRFHAIAALLYWALCLPWLLVGDRDAVVLIFIAMFLSGIGYGLVNVIQFTIGMRLCPASIEGFMFCTLMSFANIGEYALGSNIITSLAPSLGGLIPAFFSLIPFSIFGLLALRPILGAGRPRPVPAPVAGGGE